MRKISLQKWNWLKKEVHILREEGVLESDVAERLVRYYAERTSTGLPWMMTIFSILGALLIGGGIILLFAHNWDELSRPVRTVLSLTPLMIAAIVSFFAVRKNENIALRESAGIFHALAIGAAIALIGQTYHIPSNVPSFFLTWLLLLLPLPFLLRSTGSILFYLVLLVTWTGISQEQNGQALAFWGLILPPVYWTVQKIRTQKYSPETLLSLWGLLLAITCSLGIVLEKTVPGLWIVIYSAFLSGIALLGMWLYREQDGWNNPLQTLGIVGISLLTYLFTWSEMWEDVGWNYIRNGWRFAHWGCWTDTFLLLLVFAFWIFCVWTVIRKNIGGSLLLIVHPLITALCFVTLASVISGEMITMFVFNLLLLAMGISYILQGCRHTKLRQLNGGMGLLTLLIVTRFFDSDIEYFARGAIFIVLGISFIGSNIYIVHRKKQLLTKGETA